jgi:hypothetical protein
MQHAVEHQLEGIERKFKVLIWFVAFDEKWEVAIWFKV